jgi:chromate reductase
MKIGLLVGSLRKQSFNRKIAKALITLAPSSLQLELIEIGNLPFFNEDEEKNPPQACVDFKNQIKTFDGFIFLTPEYNRSIAPALKNALDIGSRPYGQNLWDKKPCAAMSASMGATGGFGANQHLRQCFVFLNMPCMQQPEAYIGQVHTLMDEKGVITNESTKTFLTKFLEAYEGWVKTFSKA